MQWLPLKLPFATPAKTKPTLKYTNPNCLRTSHTIDQCWQPGGGNEGGGPSHARSKQKDDKIKDCPTTVYLAAPAPILSTSEMALIGSTVPSTPLIFYQPSASHYSADWSCMSLESSASSYVAPVPSLISHYLDSGSSSHVRPYHDDFIHLQTIALCAIQGISGAQASAIGIGTIILHCNQKSIALKNSLFVLSAIACLISIGVIIVSQFIPCTT
jgi:hypothetical protein